MAIYFFNGFDEQFHIRIIEQSQVISNIDEYLLKGIWQDIVRKKDMKSLNI